ncbi:MAG: heliorhodopsin HeR [bacterium]|nr:heliorhodopsin HeR [bacterium]
MPKPKNNAQLPDGQHPKLRGFNICMGVLHFAQATAMYFLSNDFTLPVTSAFVEFDRTSQTLVPMVESVFEFRLGPIVALFLLLSAIAHWTISLPGVYQWYLRNLGRGANYARWIEYSFSSSVMIVVVAMLTGMYDGISLMLMFFLNAMMILFGWMMELHNQSTKQTNWTAYWFGIIAGAVPWVAIALYLLNAGSGEAKAPSFVYWIFFSIFVFFNIFAVNMVLQYKKIGKWRDYLYGEKAYIVLSLVAKSLLAWQVWAGTLRPV